MKKIILAAFSLFVFGAAHAQLKFGVKAGVNFASISNSYSGLGSDFNEDYKTSVGFNAGGFVEIKLSDKFALQPEVLFSMEGAKLTSSSNDGVGFSSSSSSKIHLDYINVPVMLKFYPIHKLFVEAGPQVGFLVSAKSKDKSSDTETDFDGVVTTTSTSQTTDVKGFYKSIDFGVNVGVGYEFTDMIYANLRYNIGLSDISKNGNVDGVDLGIYGDVFKTKNNVLSLSVGFKF